MRHPHISLSDKYDREDGEVFLTGIQALVRLVLDQRRRDSLADLKTGGFISGYRGSPLGGLDQQLWRAAEFLDRAGVTFTPGVNEDLGATSVWGSQQVGLYPGANVDGVFGLWYGKAPGVDRSGDALKHANFAGTSANGGVLAIAGDDHDCKSSTLPSQSEFAFADAEIPVLNPSDIQDVLDFGLYGWALSRFSGLWVGLIALADTMDSAATVRVGAHHLAIRSPAEFKLPPQGLSIRPHDAPLAKEQRVRKWKLPAAQAFVRANGLDRVAIDGPRARYGIAATGKAYQDVRQAMDVLGLSDKDAADLGLRLYKIAMPWPLEPESAKEFAGGLDKVLVVEHKRPLIESQLKDTLYDLPDRSRPRILGKTHGHGRPLLSDTGSVTAEQIARALIEFLPKTSRTEELGRHLARLAEQRRVVDRIQAKSLRTPFYCSGCPHNKSTAVPEGSRALAGIGCHYMAMFMDRETDTPSQMGGEGAMWIGQSPFTDEPHIFANLGDGTYHHSGLLAVRAAIAASQTMTYKLLFNDAVAMTGGQPIEGQMSVAQITQELAAEGVKRIAIVSESPDQYDKLSVSNVSLTVSGRDELSNLQDELRKTDGVSVLIYDQTCAAEKRRRRKRGQLEDPSKRVVINAAVCEGCGDCTAKSNCLSVEPLETEFGCKRRINQSSCNKDYSCLDGFCPSFVTVEGAKLRKAERSSTDSRFKALQTGDLPKPHVRTPQVVEDGPFNIVITGIGGAGVTTASAILGMAAHIDGKASTTLDMTGLAQKGGAVVSHVRIGEPSRSIHGGRIPDCHADALIAADTVVAANADTLRLTHKHRTRAIVNADVAPTAEFINNNDISIDETALQESIATACRRTSALDATRLAETMFGDSIYANSILLGFAFQQGLVPLSWQAIETAFELNGASADTNIQAFRLGRLVFEQPELMNNTSGPAEPSVAPPSQTLDQFIERRTRVLINYQNSAYAQRYLKLVKHAARIETARIGNSTRLTEAVAKNYFKLLAYKDEYEVARLYTDGTFAASLNKQFEDVPNMKVYLAPPLLARSGPDGKPRKMAFGRWIFPVFKLVARFKFLRGTVFDPFGFLAERQEERALISSYEDDVGRLLKTLSTVNLDAAVAIAELPDQIRGFGHIKSAAIKRAKASAHDLWRQFDAPSPVKHAA